MTGVRSALLAVQIALVVGVVASVAQVWVVLETIKDLRVVKESTVNGDLLRIARWSAFVAPLIFGLFVYMSFLAFLGVHGGLPDVVTASGLFIRWSYTVIMLVALTWSVGDLLVRRRLTGKNLLVEDAALRERIIGLERRVDELTGEVNRRPTREQLIADNEILEALVKSLRGRLQSEGTE